MRERYGDTAWGRFPWEQIFQMNKLHLEILRADVWFFLRSRFSLAMWHKMDNT